MKTKAEQAKHGDKKDLTRNHTLNNGELKTDRPLSEKDEVKQAESRMSKPLRHHFLILAGNLSI
jgi:hypothetical protein